MATTLAGRAYSGVLTMGFVLALSVGLSAQSRPAAAAPVARDLNSTLAELTRVAPATSQDLDLAYQQQPGGVLRWVAFWRADRPHDVQMAEALRRNLQFAVPNLVHDTQASGGSISTAFKLYNDLTVVCESLNSLLRPGSRESRADFRALNNDFYDMNRLKEELSAYIQQTAASVDSKNPQLMSSAGRPKRIIVDDNIPENPSPKKRRSAHQ